MPFGPESVESVPHTNPQTPNRSVHFHFSPPTKTYFCRASILQIVFPVKMNLGKFQGTIYILFPLWFQFAAIFSWVLTHGVVLASGHSIGGIKSLTIFSSIKCLGPVKEARVNVFHNKPHSILPHDKASRSTRTQFGIF